MQTPEGRQYNETFETQFSGALQKCVQAAPADCGKFEILVSITQDGVINYLQSRGVDQVPPSVLRQGRYGAASLTLLDQD
jgi:hypothetical protein